MGGEKAVDSQKTDKEAAANQEEDEHITLQQIRKAHEEILKAKEAQLALLERRLEEAEKRAPGSFETGERELYYRIVLGKVGETNSLVEKRL